MICSKAVIDLNLTSNGTLNSIYALIRRHFIVLYSRNPIKEEVDKSDRRKQQKQKKYRTCTTFDYNNVTC